MKCPASGWEDGSVGKALSPKCEIPSSAPQNPHKARESNVFCNSSVPKVMCSVSPVLLKGVGKQRQESLRKPVGQCIYSL